MTTTEAVRETPAVLTVTDAAAAQLKKLVQTHNPEAAGIRLGVSEGGCNGLTYAMDFAEEKGPTDEEMELDGVILLIDPMAVMYLVGTEMDFVEEKLGSNFVFRNPNESGRCGCGESFSV
ncbi:MAG: Fe-S cluster assembly scaffold SufA [Rhodospirillaceae bacterium]|nr:Fe-S cluster assembly scaffold SufA [Rhodospirillaceae bacterium]|tara:strand:+ start:21049 stop:21408 length:360 start_codon:yes stop_codon:yes gene_type:complete